jgi:rhodanese-related sulfurtransferase
MIYSDPIPSISVEELSQYLAHSNGDQPLQLIDVREPSEVEKAYIEGFDVFPLSHFEQWSTQITTDYNSEVETFVICHHGMRSAQMCQWLRNQGFTNVKNIEGGIDAYSRLVDSTIPRY